MYICTNASSEVHPTLYDTLPRFPLGNESYRPLSTPSGAYLEVGGELGPATTQLISELRDGVLSSRGSVTGGSQLLSQDGKFSLFALELGPVGLILVCQGPSQLGYVCLEVSHLQTQILHLQ